MADEDSESVDAWNELRDLDPALYEQMKALRERAVVARKRPADLLPVLISSKRDRGDGLN